ncbi:MAG TPA: SMC-Scp complex subunit ScpB, partial [Candidatus Polarisedimenticolaceae bacterium]|nr:SMC-Scp complex subunit ScpB [Candidatus Polarisedimenticolaceae bacterium]
LAIVAYRQPITAPEIQAIRGKDPSAALKTLLEKKLLRILGRKKVVGNPLLYGTSKQFLIHFGLNSLSDLPAIEDFEELVEALAAEQPELFAADAEEEGEGDTSDGPPWPGESDEWAESVDGETRVDH